MSGLREYRTSAVIGGGLTICGIPPARPLVTIEPHACWNCSGTRVLRTFSGSGWYEDSRTCLDCGENVTSGYRPFRRAWRKANIASAEKRLPDAIPWDAFHALTAAAIREEMEWDE